MREITEAIRLTEEVRQETATHAEHDKLTKVLTLLYKAADNAIARELCTGCQHEPKSGDPYPTPCGECRRWYSDEYNGNGK